MMSSTIPSPWQQRVDSDIAKIMENKPDSFVQLMRRVGFRIADRWHDVGIQLMFSTEELDQIEQNCRPMPVEQCCKEMLYSWRQRKKGITVNELVQAIKDAGNVYYASQLQQELKLLGQEKLLDLPYLESNVVCRIATDWYDVGLYLDIPAYELDKIRQLSNPTGSKCTEMLKKWWTSRTPDDPDTSRRNVWRNMYDAMRAVELIKAAEDLKCDLYK
ncbi:uncharacterized protein [Dysidea avara]|uniref:uncharacterized protein n=1 Tax=Dysidea avara TaxID=196820 RepID=UPI0033297A65